MIQDKEYYLRHRFVFLKSKHCLDFAEPISNQLDIHWEIERDLDSDEYVVMFYNFKAKKKSWKKL